MKRKKARSSKATVRSRVEQVLDMRLAGAQKRDVRRFAAENKWRISERQLERYIQASDELLAASLEKDRAKLINRHLGQRQALYARAADTGDYRTALAVLKDLAQLGDLYPGSRPPPAGLPRLDQAENGADVVQLLAAVINATAAGELDPRLAGMLAQLSGALMKTVEQTGQEQRLAELEKLVGKMGLK
jgi:hypothetical protein